MSIVLTVLYVLLALIAAPLIIALFIPRHYSVSVSQRIRRPKKDVYDYISRLQNQPVYSEWLRHDSSLRPELEGIDGTVGATLRWNSTLKDKEKSSGKGELIIRNMNENEIDIALNLIEPMPGICQLLNTFTAVDENVTSYRCTFSAYARYPINLPSYLIGRHFIRKNQQKTLDNIKQILEQG